MQQYDATTLDSGPVPLSLSFAFLSGTVARLLRCPAAPLPRSTSTPLPRSTTTPLPRITATPQHSYSAAPLHCCAHAYTTACTIPRLVYDLSWSRAPDRISKRVLSPSPILSNLHYTPPPFSLSLSFYIDAYENVSAKKPALSAISGGRGSIEMWEGSRGYLQHTWYFYVYLYGIART